MRPRDLGIVIGTGRPGPHNAITDVAGVGVGHATLVRGYGPLVVGRGPVRTGVTVVMPRPEPIFRHPLFAGCHRLNGNGELTGLEWVRESGLLTSPIALTNTHSVGVVRDALVAWEVRQRQPGEAYWSLPVVGETWDGVLSDVGGQHVSAADCWAAVGAAGGGPVAEGAVGGGTGTICHGFKGGIGTSSRLATVDGEVLTVGVLVQANQGRRDRLTVAGVPVGRHLTAAEVPLPGPERHSDAAEPPEGTGSIIVVVATDAPLLPGQCRRVAQRAALGIGRTGGVGEHTSGDLILCFATGNRDLPEAAAAATTAPRTTVTMLDDHRIDALFDAVVEATEEAIVSALLAVDTMVGRDGIIAHRLPPDRLRAVMAGAG
ncbi:MAG TPA: P1 family peptidase [Candidatus Micrarchaeia archaeon]|nr:P1 family peptidase [Candidatus Micrarchaeia archaeon]